MTKYVIEKSELYYVNKNAEVVIVGKTPGNSQLNENTEGLSPIDVKKKRAFAGNIRKSLCKMLNFIHINKLLGIVDCSSLWNEDYDKVDFTSIFINAIYVINDGTQKKRMLTSYTQKQLVNNSVMKEEFENGFKKDCEEKYKNVKLWVACGPDVYATLTELQKQNVINPDSKVIEIAHPSGANRGRINAYIERFAMDKSTSLQVEFSKKAEEIVLSLIK